MLAPLIGLLIGFAFHQSGSRQLARAAPGTAVETRGQLLTLAYTLILFAPFNAYFLAFAPDWSFLYAVDTHEHLGLLIVVSLLLDCGSVVLGFHLARRYFSHSPTTLLRVLVPALAVVLVFLALGRRRLGVDASYEQFHGDFGVRSVAGSALGYSLLWLGTLFTAATAWTAVQFRRLGE
jgi:hypothetical protein